MFHKLTCKVSHSKFILYFSLLMYVIYNTVNFEKLTQWFMYKGELDYFGLISYLILGYCLFLLVFTLIAHKYTTKLVAVFLIISSTLVAYFIKKFNIAMDTSMLQNILHTDATESLPLFSSAIIPYVIFLIILPIFLLTRVQIVYKSFVKQTLSSLTIIVLSLALIAGVTYTAFKQIHRAANLSNKYIVYSLVPVNYLAAIIDVIKKTAQPIFEGEEEVDKEIATTITKKEDLVVVLAIGEAIRQKNLNIYGYTGNTTTPLLSKIEDLYALNGVARLGSTLYALKEILKKDDVKLTHITNSAGIDTTCYVHYQVYGNCSVGEISAQKGKHDKTYDEDVIPLLENNLKSYVDGSRLIVLHFGGGAHGPIYSLRHPAEYKKLQPSCEDPDMLNACTEEERYNAYDNAMLYQDYVINETITKLEDSKIPYVFIFLSDHGESLGEGGYVFHGMPPGMALPKEQGSIPLLVKSSLPIEIIKKDIYTQPDVFDTVLHLLNIETKEFDKSGNFIQKP